MSTPLLYSALTAMYWGLVLVIVGLGVAAAAVTLRVPRRWLVIAAGATIVAGIVAVVIPHDKPVPAVSVLLGLAVLALSVLGGGPATLFVLALASKGTVREGTHGGIVVDRASVPGGAAEPGEVLRGGTAIGVFERLATTGSIMAGFPEALAVLVALKSVGRFSELDVAEARERFIIGSLVSLVWAAACGALFRFALGV
ncbi:hypothetical protein [Humibacter ginsenosidimutans]|uniref:Uncharacterized protein n=1 Tax=Humibacter ginsenosidimutans TaxID=2599293 RepID=A0A5B8LYX3_9MICO|nr:hypothetical protein [Humibacter ginsenosidimutans]QDZ13547.1 hypothetical protein FPZ11_00860 [Humibacter ginsenosidimutans]